VDIDEEIDLKVLPPAMKIKKQFCCRQLSSKMEIEADDPPTSTKPDLPDLGDEPLRSATDLKKARLRIKWND
jgi:hypothetical protein